MTVPSIDITALLKAWRHGDAAAFDRLAPPADPTKPPAAGAKLTCAASAATAPPRAAPLSTKCTCGWSRAPTWTGRIARTSSRSRRGRCGGSSSMPLARACASAKRGGALQPAGHSSPIDLDAMTVAAVVHRGRMVCARRCADGAGAAGSAAVAGGRAEVLRRGRTSRKRRCCCRCRRRRSMRIGSSRAPGSRGRLRIPNRALSIRWQWPSRLLLQPMVASIFAVRSGLADARASRPPDSRALFSDPAHRAEMVKDGWKSVRKVFVLALILYVIYCVSRRHPPRLWWRGARDRPPAGDRTGPDSCAPS